MNCKNCKHYTIKEGTDISNVDNRFLHTIGINENTTYVAPCYEIVFQTTDGYNEIGFADNFGCIYFEENTK